jgi:hypothetical protein
MRIEKISFMMGWTIEAVLRLKNPLVQQGTQLEELVKKFNELNNFECTTIGKQYIIPIVEKYQIEGKNER